MVFVCENNLYMEYTPIGSVTAVRASGRRPRAPPTAWSPIVVDGNDADAVYDGALTMRSRRRARAAAPSLIEALTYRHGGHSRADPGKYRPDDEVAQWLARDPVPGYRKGCSSAGSPKQDLDAIDERARAAVDLATEEAKAGPVPRPGLAETNVWGDGGAAGGTEPMASRWSCRRWARPCWKARSTPGTGRAGDQVTEGEPLLEIGTDKVDTDIPAPASGTLAEVRVGEGETVPVATVLAIIDPNGSS